MCIFCAPLQGPDRKLKLPVFYQQILLCDACCVAMEFDASMRQNKDAWFIFDFFG